MTEDKEDVDIKIDGRIPNPGSNEAIKMGCTCPIIDNRYGAGIKTDSGAVLFWYSEDCPVHEKR